MRRVIEEAVVEAVKIMCPDCRGDHIGTKGMVFRVIAGKREEVVDMVCYDCGRRWCPKPYILAPK